MFKNDFGTIMEVVKTKPYNFSKETFQFRNTILFPVSAQLPNYKVVVLYILRIAQWASFLAR